MIPNNCPVLDRENIEDYIEEFYDDEDGFYCSIEACPFNNDEYCSLVEFVFNLSLLK